MRGRPLRWTRCSECCRVVVAVPDAEGGGYTYGTHWVGPAKCPQSIQPVSDRLVYRSVAEVPAV